MGLREDWHAAQGFALGCEAERDRLREENERLRLAIYDFWVYINGAPILDFCRAFEGTSDE